MSLSNNPAAFRDCYDIMDRALEDPAGVRWAAPSTQAAYHFRMRCNHARSINRTENAATYEKGHHLHNKSAYDHLSFKVRTIGTASYVYLERQPILDEGRVESLSEVGLAPALDAPKPQLLIEGPKPTPLNVTRRA